MRRLIIYLLFFFILIFNGLFTLGQEDSEKISVKLHVRGELKDIVYNHFFRELQDINDVIIRDEDPDLALEVVAIEPELRKGGKSGEFIIFMVIFDNFYKKGAQIIASCADFKTTENLRNEDLFSGKDDGQVLLMNAISLLTQYKGLWLQVEDKKNLKTICEQFIEEFDSKFIENWRQQRALAFKNKKH